MTSCHEIVKEVSPPSNLLNYAEKKVIGAKTPMLAIGLNARGNKAFSMVELTRIELATS
jgi:hypothetical protein